MGMGMGMGAAENGAAWEAPKSPFDGGCWLGGTFRGYAKKMLLGGRRRLWGIACTMHHGELFPDGEAAVYGFNLQDPADADAVEPAGRLVF
jgi:hypothetical protein